MSPFTRRRPGGPSMFSSGPLIALGVLVVVAVIFETLWGLGLIDLSKLRSSEPSTAGLVAIPTPGRPIPAYARVTRDHLWDAKKNRLAMVYVRQSTPQQVLENRESRERQYALAQFAERLGWPAERVVVIDEDQGQSGKTAAERSASGVWRVTGTAVSLSGATGLTATAAPTGLILAPWASFSRSSGLKAW